MDEPTQEKEERAAKNIICRKIIEPFYQETIAVLGSLKPLSSTHDRLIDVRSIAAERYKQMASIIDGARKLCQ